MIRLTASSFELTPNNESSNSEHQQSLSGSVYVDDNNSESFQLLKELSSKDNIDKVVVVYHKYSFSLKGVSFSGNNMQHQGMDRTFKFHAKDVHLEGMFGS